MKKYRSFNPLLYRFVKYMLLPVMKRVYRIESVNAKIFDDLEPPFIVVGNHSTFFDPFMTAAGIPYPVHYLTTDSVLQGVLGWLIRRTGVIPVIKNLNDVRAVRNLLYLKEKKQVIGIYPEGQTSWDGCSGKLYPALAKLLKILKLPVVSARTLGGYHIDPKWGHGKRTGRVRVEYDLILTTEDIRQKRSEQILERIARSIKHDDLAYITEKKLTFPSPRGAEYLERALSYCPVCFSFARLKSKGNTLTCQSCGTQWH